MNKRNFTFVLSLIFLLNLVFRVDVNTATQDYIPINVDIEHLPKNILVGSFLGGRSHLKPLLDIAAILIERGHSVSIKNFLHVFYIFSQLVFYLTIFINLIRR